MPEPEHDAFSCDRRRGLSSVVGDVMAGLGKVLSSAAPPARGAAVAVDEGLHSDAVECTVSSREG